MSIEELKAFIDEIVDRRLEERIRDPDLGLEVKSEVIQKIRKSRRNKTTVIAETVAKSLGLAW